MPLLALKKLTIRFGGLTAVNEVDCALEENQIVSVIGPNGAGKTTVFNAVTGIYEPTSGQIEFAGRPLRREMSPRVWLTAVAVGLITALAMCLAAANVDRLWQASIKRNYAGPDQPFSLRLRLAQRAGLPGRPIGSHAARRPLGSRDGRRTAHAGLG